MTQSDKITVMLVDDSRVIRKVLSGILSSDPSIEVIASVPEGRSAISVARRMAPDVAILDVEMPVIDGLTALPEILQNSPDTKVIMFSSLTARGADTTIKALALGAVDCLVKPSGAEAMQPDSPFRAKLLSIIKSLYPEKSGSSLRPTGLSLASASAPSSATRPSSPTAQPPSLLRNDTMAYKGKPDILAIGSSTGGPKALFQALKDIGPLNIPIVITQHMPSTFTKILAEHIHQHAGLAAFEGEDGMAVEPGKVYVAPGGRHMLFEKSGTALRIKLDDGPPENFCKPAVDPMLRSLIEIYGKTVLIAILTGMGHDGLKGSQMLVEHGGRVIAQDKETSVIWGMPGAVAEAGLCSAILPLHEIGDWVKQACR